MAGTDHDGFRTASHRDLSRRGLLRSGAVAGVGAAVGWGARGIGGGGVPDMFGGQTEPFHGDRQAGVDTEPQAHVALVGFDVRPGVGRDRLVGVLKVWTDDAARLTQGGPALADTEPELARNPSRLTVTVGFGPGVFSTAGLEHLRPRWLRPLPAYPIDRLEDRWSGGDLLLQVCADDPMTVAHAVRVLSKDVRSSVTVRWTQRGFRPARGAAPRGTTMRNLMGQLDGTVNPEPGTADFERVVRCDPTVDPDTPAWLAGGTSLVLRRIRIEMDTWDEIDPVTRGVALGRRQDTGAPLTGTREHDEPDFRSGDLGIPTIAPNSHIARASDLGRRDEQIFRRGYNYDEMPEPGQVSNSGLLFVSFQANPDRQYLPIQARLAEADLLNTWTTPIGSAVFVVPPGCVRGSYLGENLFEPGARW